MPCGVISKRNTRPTATIRPSSLQHGLKVHLLAPLHRFSNLPPLSLAHMHSCTVPARLLLLSAEATCPEMVALTRVTEQIEEEHKDGQAGRSRDKPKAGQSVVG